LGHCATSAGMGPLQKKRTQLFSERAASSFLSNNYLVVSSLAVSAACFLRLSQLYFFWNFSTRPVVSTYFILPVKKGWQAEQISTVIFFRVLRVTNLLPQPQVTVASTYLGWI